MQIKNMYPMSNQMKTFPVAVWRDEEKQQKVEGTQLSLHLIRQSSMWAVMVALTANDKPIASQTLYYEDSDNAKLSMIVIESLKNDKAQALYNQQREAEDYVEYMANGDDQY